MKTLKTLNITEIQQINGGGFFDKLGEYWDAFIDNIQDIADRANPLVDHTPQS